MEGTSEISAVFWLGTTVMLVFASGLIFLALYYQNHFARTKRKEAELMLKVSLESEMNERHRIAADLHDSVCGDLTAIKFYLEHLTNRDRDVDGGLVISEISESLDNALQNTRNVSYSLMPPLLESMGLCVALDDHLKRLTAQTAIPFTFSCNVIEPLEATVSYALFRAVQEFNTNMLKYGSITKCYIEVIQLDDTITIKISDDGKPFSFAIHSEMSSGAGLRNISSRLKVVNARLTQEAVNSGNRFIITLNPKTCCELAL